MTNEYFILKKHWLLGSKSAKIKEDLPMYSIEMINAQCKQSLRKCSLENLE